MKIGLLIFDFDGTLFNTKKDIANALNFALEANGIPPLAEEKIWRFTGEGTPKLIERVLRNFGMELFEKVLKMTLEYYNEHCTDYTKPLDGVEGFLKETEHIPKIILSNKYKYLIDITLEKFGLKKYFIETYGRESFEINKPDPAPLYEILRIHGFSKDNTIYIGDTVIDIIFSKNAGIPCCIIPSGASPVEEIEKEQPAVIFKYYKELLKNLLML